MLPEAAPGSRRAALCAARVLADACGRRLWAQPRRRCRQERAGLPGGDEGGRRPVGPEGQVRLPPERAVFRAQD
ncbi:MAG: hypothetical protein WBN94_09655 [Methanothrix sp.]